MHHSRSIWNILGTALGDDTDADTSYKSSENFRRQNIRAPIMDFQQKTSGKGTSFSYRFSCFSAKLLDIPHQQSILSPGWCTWRRCGNWIDIALGPQDTAGIHKLKSAVNCELMISTNVNIAQEAQNRDISWYVITWHDATLANCTLNIWQHLQQNNILRSNWASRLAVLVVPSSGLDSQGHLERQTWKWLTWVFDRKNCSDSTGCIFQTSGLDVVSPMSPWCVFWWEKHKHWLLDPCASA